MTTAKTKAGAAKTDPAEAVFDAFKVQFPMGDFMGTFRELAETSLGQAREAYGKMKTVAEEATDAIEDSYETAREGTTAVGLKALDLARANTEASFAFAKQMMGAKTLAEAIEIQTAFARKQFDVLAAQTKDFQEATRKVTVDSLKPLRKAVEKNFEDLKVA